MLVGSTIQNQNRYKLCQDGKKILTNFDIETMSKLVASSDKMPIVRYIEQSGYLVGFVYLSKFPPKLQEGKILRKRNLLNVARIPKNATFLIENI